MIIVDKETLETFNEIEVSRMYPHIGFDFSDAEIVGEVLGALGMAVVSMPAQPVFDSRYQVATVGDVAENDGVYSSTWVLSPVDLPINEMAAIKAAEITLACETAITSGFSSSALGDQYFYSCDIPAQLNIQANLLGASVGRTDIRHICTDSNGSREIRAHSALQMIGVGESMGAHIWTQLEKANELRIEIGEAVAGDDVDALIAISW